MLILPNLSESLIIRNARMILRCNSFTQNRKLTQLHHQKSLHTPVMVNEVIEIFNPKNHQILLDMTFGAGGHTKSLLSTSENLTVVALDRDPVAYSISQQLEEEFSGRLIPLKGKFSNLQEVLESKGLNKILFDGILIDCGCSSMQLDSTERGFAISNNGPLDMRMNPPDEILEPSVADVLAHIDEANLTRILKVYGEEKQAKKIARAIVESRYLFKTIQTTKELADLVECACGFPYRKDKLQRFSHVATKTFQALRIFVNDELNELDYALRLSPKILKTGGKIVTIAFHSLEDRIIKSHLVNSGSFEVSDVKFKDLSRTVGPCDLLNIIDQRWSPIYKHVLTPREHEVIANPRSRSAKLRAAIKIR